ncbi:MAG: hypothetical protein LUE14_07820 [Clostridiales bacterium]|nr:hypothetical protein [Clostridiales bacterium]
MRGYIYEMSTDPKDLGKMDEELFYDLSDREFNYAENVSREVSDTAIDDLIRSLRKYGATEVWEKDSNGKVLHGFIVDEACKQNYFRQRYEKLKADINNLTLPEFIQGGAASRLEQAITDRYDDCAYVGYLQPLDTFIRDAEKGKAYFVGNVAYMH